MSVFKITNLNYLQDKDFGEFKEVLAEVNASPSKVGKLADVLSRVALDPWSASPNDFSVANAKVLYLGVNKPAFPTVRRFSNVMIIELSDDSVNFSGQKLYLTFN